MFITKKHLSRRTFLLGSFGATVALPMLDAMVPALTAQSRTAAAPALRFGAVYIPNGVHPDFWVPDTPGSDFEFKQVMKPMEPFRDNVVVVSKLKAPAGSVHLGASAAFLNGIGPAGQGGDFTALISVKTVDQHIADRVGGDTPLRSLEVGTEDMGTTAGACDGYPCAFFNALSWRDDTTPLPVAINPRVTFERMFGETGTTEQRVANLKTKQSMLDSVLEETNKLKAALGPADNRILDEYLTNVRTVEEQLTRMESRVANLAEADAPIGIPEFFDDHMTVTYNLMHLAFQGDITRVFTFLTGHEASSRSYAHIGVPEAHHTISHHANNPETMAKYAKIGTYQIAKMAEFVAKLAETPDGDGTLLDHSLLYFGSGMSNGNVHDRKNAPALLVGGAGGRMKGNRHLVADEKNEEPTANLLVGMAGLYGVELDHGSFYSWDTFRL
ncbi:MAG: DUF1552 domain-containing protein [Vicinamibacterales bacterium]